ncbi:MAG TPA: hypothetical protein VF158_00940 [Longimicrobiales bacterium]
MNDFVSLLHVSESRQDAARSALERIAVALGVAGGIAGVSTAGSVPSSPQLRSAVAGALIGYAIAVVGAVVGRYRVLRGRPTSDRPTRICDALMVGGLLVGVAATVCGAILMLVIDRR